MFLHDNFKRSVSPILSKSFNRLLDSSTLFRQIGNLQLQTNHDP